MRWGLLPGWVEDPRQFSLLFNARAETVMERPAFKNAMKRRRCLIPADGYYEWQASEKRKRPHFIYRRDRQPIGLAGLAETWIGPNGEELDTVAIVTAPASADLAVLHDRVPVTIAPGDFDRWLVCGAHDAETAMGLLTAPGEGEFAWHQVSTRSAVPSPSRHRERRKKPRRANRFRRHQKMTGREVCFENPLLVMPGLVPGIHVFLT